MHDLERIADLFRQESSRHHLADMVFFLSNMSMYPAGNYRHYKGVEEDGALRLTLSSDPRPEETRHYDTLIERMNRAMRDHRIFIVENEGSYRLYLSGKEVSDEGALRLRNKRYHAVQLDINVPEKDEHVGHLYRYVKQGMLKLQKTKM